MAMGWKLKSSVDKYNNKFCHTKKQKAIYTQCRQLKGMNMIIVVVHEDPLGRFTWNIWIVGAHI